MTKINKYQKIVLLLYGIAFIYLSILHVPFKIKRGSELVYDTLFSNRPNIDFSRLCLVIIITTLISGVFFLVVRNLQLTFKLKSMPKPKPVFYILMAVIIIAFSAFLFFQRYGSNFTLNKTAKKIDSTVSTSSDTKIETTLPILDTKSSIDVPPFFKNKYLYNGKIYDFTHVFHAAKQSNLDVGAYIEKAGILVIGEDSLPIPKTELNQKVKKVKMIFPDGSIGDINIDDTLNAIIKAKARRY